MADPVAQLLDQVSEQIDNDFVPPISTIQAVRRFVAAMARNHARNSLVTLDDGRVVCVAKGSRLLGSTDEPDEIA